MGKLENEFKEVRECEYKGEKYSVRDNGAILRHHKEGGRKRSLDNQWTFGKKNEQNGYMRFSSHSVHIIVATAFHGVRDSKKFVVDHIDTNRCNNRADNLRWLTRLENVLLNEITLHKIKFLFGGNLDQFFENPASIRTLADSNPNYSWMRSVSEDEAKNTLTNLKNMINKSVDIKRNDKLELRTNNINNKEWIFKSQPKFEIRYKVRDEYTKAIYPSLALQKEWPTPSEFPCCPVTIDGDPINCYLNKLEEDKIYLRNKYTESRIIKVGTSSDRKEIYVLSKITNNAKDFQLTKITYNGKAYIHSRIENFFDIKGGLKYFTLACGEEWTGGDTFDDGCR